MKAFLFRENRFVEGCLVFDEMIHDPGQFVGRGRDRLGRGLS